MTSGPNPSVEPTKSARTGARTARTEAGAAGSRADLAAEAADATARRVLHDARINTQGRSAGSRAQHIGIGDIQVVAGDGNIQVVLERESDGIVQRQVELAVVHELVDARGVGQVRRRQVACRVGADRVGKMRYRLGIIQHWQAAASQACFAARAQRAPPEPNLS